MSRSAKASAAEHAAAEAEVDERIASLDAKLSPKLKAWQQADAREAEAAAAGERRKSGSSYDAAAPGSSMAGSSRDMAPGSSRDMAAGSSHAAEPALAVLQSQDLLPLVLRALEPRHCAACCRTCRQWAATARPLLRAFAPARWRKPHMRENPRHSSLRVGTRVRVLWEEVPDPSAWYAGVVEALSPWDSHTGNPGMRVKYHGYMDGDDNHHWHDLNTTRYRIDPRARASCGASTVPPLVGGEFAIDRSTLVSIGAAGDDKCVSVLSIGGGAARLQCTLTGHTEGICCVAIDGDCVVSGADGGELLVWSLRRRQRVAMLSPSSKAEPKDDADPQCVPPPGASRILSDVYAVAVEGGQIVAGDAGGLLHLWQQEGGQVLASDADGLLHLRSGRQWSRIASFEAWQADSRTRSFAASGTTSGTTSGDDAELMVMRVAFSEFGIVDCGEYGAAVLRLRPFATEDSAVETMPSPVVLWHGAAVYGLAVDGALLATGCADKRVRTWCIDPGRAAFATCTRSINGHDDWVYSVALRGTLLVSGSFDGTVRVWAARLDPAEDATDPSEEEEGCSSFGVQAQGVFKHGSATEAGSAEATDDARDCQPPTRRWYDPYEAHVLEHGGKVEAVGISEHGVVLSGSYEPDELRVWTPDLGTY